MFAERMSNKGNQQGYNNDNSWGGQNVRKSYDYYHHSNNRGGDYQQHHEGGKFEQRMQSLRLDNERSSKGSASGGEQQQQQQQQSSGPKKMTWATIASQPAKPQVSTISTTIKKKGPGMPPPPIIPGKHSLELNDSWDTPKTGPLVPSPPVITAPPIDLSSLEKQNNSNNFDGQPAWPTPDQAVSQVNTNNNSQQQGNSQAQQQQPPHHHQHQQPPPSRGYQQYNNNNNNNNNSNGNNNYHRGGYNQNNSYNNHQQQQQQQQHYNDNYKPYHQNPHQMPTAPTSQNQSSANVNEYSRERMPPRNNMQHQQTRHEPPAHQTAAAAVLPIATASQASSSAGDYIKKPIASTATTAVIDENVLEQLRGKNQYNPAELDLSQVENARFFVIKSYSEDDIHRSIKYEIWCSTEHGNKRLDQAFRERERENGVIYLFFSVNSSGHFCGVAQMMTSVDYNSNSSVWSQDKWKGSFRVKWIYVKDVPNTQLRHIRLENNENKPVTNSRDTQEVPNGHGIQIMKIVHAYKHTTSIFDDFTHYEKRQEEEDTRKNESHDSYRPMTLPASHHSTHNRENANRQQQQYSDSGRGGGSYDRGDRGDRDYSNGGGYDRGGSNFNNGGSYNKYGSGYNNDYKPSFNGNRGGYQKRNDFRNGNGDQQPQSGGGFYRANNNDDFGNRGGYRSDRGGNSRGRGGGYRPPMNN